MRKGLRLSTAIIAVGFGVVASAQPRGVPPPGPPPGAPPGVMGPPGIGTPTAVPKPAPAPPTKPTPPAPEPSAPPTQFDTSAKADSYQFDPNTVLRDPFEAPLVQRKGESEEEEILRFDIKEIKLVAVMKGIGAPKCMLKLPNNKYHIMQVGDVIGKGRDHIFEIKSRSIVLEKKIKDFKGNIKSQLYVKDMDAKS